VFPAGSERKEKPIAVNIANVYCTASWMPHMRIALSNTLLSVSDYAASINCPSWSRSRPRTSIVRGDLLQYTCWLVANSLRNIVKHACWHLKVPEIEPERAVFVLEWTFLVC